MAKIAHNLQEALIRNKPYLAYYFAQTSKNPIFHLENDSHISYHSEGRLNSLSSRYNPERELEQMLAQDKTSLWKSSEIVCIFGLGNPAILTKVLGLLKKNQICIAIDASFELAQIICQESTILWNFLKRPGCHLFCGTELQMSMQQYIASLPIESLSLLRIISHPPSTRLNPDFYSQAKALIQKLITTRMSDLLTRLEFEHLWVKNIISHSCYLPDPKHPNAASYTIGKYKNVLSKIPGVLVASGPSLEDSFEELKILKEKAFIICVDSALKVLLKAGIEPHGVIVLDAQAHTFFSFSGLSLSKYILFADIASNPQIIRKTNAQRIIFSTTAQTKHNFDGKTKLDTTIGSEFVQKIYGEIGYLESGGSVATSGFDLLRFLGCDPILLIGLDQAYSGRKIHSNGSHQSERWLSQVSRTKSLAGTIEEIVQKRETFHLAGIGGKQVLSDYVLNLYKSWFEEAISRSPQKVYQLTAQGAILESAIAVESPLSFAKAIPINDAILKIYQKNGLFADLPIPSLKKHRALRELLKALDKIDNIDNINNINDIENKSNKANEIGNDEENSFENLFISFPFLKFASHKAELYIKRNKEKLTKKHASKIYNTRVRDILKKLARSLSHLS